ncbi:hypothetical protein [Actinokineospora cianjurensis]|uniref:Uncharacterized protein n=1 Tax=Actinokineospora cianjurensis TaxID=585224 RepID=A0A421AYC5_9PSEU|nr:hypothetical protein [Actinokineospora cianjurensis]RLK54818.1 hypothetical protein CLV68_5206 [Actinokineospora cianjurensis]
MPVTLDGLDPWAVNLRVSEREARYALGAILGPAPGRLMGWSSGVLPTRTDGTVIADLRPVLRTNDGLGVTISVGQCVIERPGQGPYICTLDETGRVELDTADPSNPRIDLIVARVYDSRLGDARTGFVVEPITGKAAPEPAAPALPPGAIPLATFALPPATRQLSTAMRTDLRRAAGTRGGVGVLLPGDALTDPGAYPGHTRYRPTGLETWDGERWRGAQPQWAGEGVNWVTRTGIRDNADINSLVVPDPGWPYRITGQGSAELATVGCRADLFLRLDAADGPIFAVGVGPFNQGGWTQTQMRSTGILTGTHAIYLTATRIFGDGTWSNTPYNTHLRVTRDPVGPA